MELSYSCHRIVYSWDFFLTTTLIVDWEELILSIVIFSVFNINDSEVAPASTTSKYSLVHRTHFKETDATLALFIALFLVTGILSEKRST